MTTHLKAYTARITSSNKWNGIDSYRTACGQVRSSDVTKYRAECDCPKCLVTLDVALVRLGEGADEEAMEAELLRLSMAEVLP